MQRSWKPNVTVAAVIERDGRFLVVEEHTDDGLRLNQPAGHLEPGESLLAAVARETLEETAHRFEPACVVGVYRWMPPNADPAEQFTYLRFAFGGTDATWVPDARLDEGIVRALWLSWEELQASRDRHRSPLVLQCVSDWRAQRRYPLALIQDF